MRQPVDYWRNDANQCGKVDQYGNLTLVTITFL